MTLALLAGCIQRASPPPIPVTATEPPPSAPLAVTTVGDDRVDALGAQWHALAGATVESGPASGNLRSRERLPDGVAWEVWTFPATSSPLTPRPRAGCTWDFVDTVGRTRGLAHADSLAVATCEPDQPNAARVLGWYARCGERAWHLELITPPGTLAYALDATQIARDSFRCGP